MSWAYLPFDYQRRVLLVNIVQSPDHTRLGNNKCDDFTPRLQGEWVSSVVAVTDKSGVGIGEEESFNDLFVALGESEGRREQGRERVWERESGKEENLERWRGR